jgi:hypothetical protein
MRNLRILTKIKTKALKSKKNTSSSKITTSKAITSQTKTTLTGQEATTMADMLCMDKILQTRFNLYRINPSNET